MDAWASHAAGVLRKLLAEPPDMRSLRGQRGRAWAARFDGERSIDAYLEIYEKILGTRDYEGLVA
jgi:hypothetical protein